MNYNTCLDTIKETFENFYNFLREEKDKVSIAINYSDEQTLLIKAYHKVTITMIVIGINNGLSYTATLIQVVEKYNHGVTTEEEAKESVIKKFLLEVFKYCKNAK